MNTHTRSCAAKMAMASFLALPMLCACSEEEAPPETANLVIAIEAEDTITEGIAAEDHDHDHEDEHDHDHEHEDEHGHHDHAISDGWSAQFDRFLIALGDVELQRASDASDLISMGKRVIVDLTHVPASGLPTWTIAADADRWNVFFETGVTPDAELADGTAQRDADLLIAEGATYFIEGSIHNDEGQSCPPNGECMPAHEIRFRWLIGAPATYGPCETSDGSVGVATPSSGTSEAVITIHGDHLFFNGFPEGDEGLVERQAQWLADADLDQDGEVTRAELESLVPSDLEAMRTFDLGGSPLPLTNLWEYVRAQVMTQAHFQGEGECPFAPL